MCVWILQGFSQRAHATRARHTRTPHAHATRALLKHPLLTVGAPLRKARGWMGCSIPLSSIVSSTGATHAHMTHAHEIHAHDARTRDTRT